MSKDITNKTIAVLVSIVMVMNLIMFLTLLGRTSTNIKEAVYMLADDYDREFDIISNEIDALSIEIDKIPKRECYIRNVPEHELQPNKTYIEESFCGTIVDGPLACTTLYFEEICEVV